MHMTESWQEQELVDLMLDDLETWAVVGLAPAGMFVTGAMMWWNRVVRKRIQTKKPRRS